MITAGSCRANPSSDSMLVGMVPARILGTSISRMTSDGADVAELAVGVARGALADAGLEPNGLAGVVFANALGPSTGQDMIRGQSWLRELSLGSVPVFNVENACAGGITAIRLARSLATDGPILVVGAETMSHGPRSTIGPQLAQGVDRADREAMIERYGERAPLMGLNAERASMFLAGGYATDEHLVATTVKARNLAASNPIALHRQIVSASEVRSAPVVASPLTRPMCCSYTDGAAAVVVGPGERGPVLRSVAVLSGDGSGAWFARFPELTGKALDLAGIDLGDIDCIELHDVTAAEELESLEAIGLFEPGAAGDATAEGRTAPGGGAVAVNTSGGLLGRGHPLGATGIAQVIEITDQLRGRSGDRQVPGARAGAALNIGGIIGREPAVLGLAILTAT